MRRIVSGRVGLVLGAGFAVAAGCTDRLPTLTDADRIPPGLVPTTIEYILETDAFLTEGFSVRGPTGIEDVDRLLVAGQFDDVLDSHVIARFGEFPDSIDYEESDGTFDWVEVNILSTVIDSLASQPELDFYLWLVDQPFDSTANWLNATNGPDSIVPWSEPGGTRGQLLGVHSWTRADTTVSGDSLFWSLPLSLVRDFVEQDVEPGFLVTLEGGGGQAQITPLTVDLKVAPLPALDTILDLTVASRFQKLMISEAAPPLPANAWSVGGFTSDRTLLRMTIPPVVPGCVDGSCPPVPTTEVVLNRVDLFLEPVPMANGFRPVATVPISIRRRFDPELGEQAPLGPVVSGTGVPPAGFETPNAPDAGFIITAVVAEALAAGDFDFGLALTMEPEASEVWYAWFDRNPRLRFVYTLRQRPELP